MKAFSPSASLSLSSSPSLSSTVYVKNSSRIHASRPASFGPHFDDPLGELMNLIPIEAIIANHSIHHPTLSLPLLGLPQRACPAHPSLSSADPPNSVWVPTHWIALVERGTCAFIDKIRFAQSLGASAVIVGDWLPSSSASLSPPSLINPNFQPDKFGFSSGLVTMFAPGDTSDVSIPSVFVARDSYISLKEDWAYYSHHQLPLDSHPYPHPSSLQVIMSKDQVWVWPFFDLLIILFFLPSILTIVTLIFHRINHFRKQRAARAPKDVVNKLPSVVWVKDMEKGIPIFDHQLGLNSRFRKLSKVQSPRPSRRSELKDLINHYLLNRHQKHHVVDEQSPLLSNSEDDDSNHQKQAENSQAKPQIIYFAQRECPLCLSEFEIGDLVRILPCGHCFHQDEIQANCMGIDSWLLKSKRLCPICRMSIIEEPSSNDPSASTEPPSSSVNATHQHDHSSGTDTLPTQSPSSALPIPATRQSVNHPHPTREHPVPSSSSLTL